MKFIGIDPGLSGGIVILERKHSIYLSKVKGISDLTERELWCLIKDNSDNAIAYIEWINPGFKGAAQSNMAKLYGSYQMLRAFLIASAIPFKEIKAGQWQRFHNIVAKKKDETQTRWKNRLKERAEHLFPNHRIILKTSDAYLIADMCRGVEGGE